MSARPEPIASGSDASEPLAIGSGLADIGQLAAALRGLPEVNAVYGVHQLSSLEDAAVPWQLSADGRSTLLRLEIDDQLPVNADSALMKRLRDACHANASEGWTVTLARSYNLE